MRTFLISIALAEVLGLFSCTNDRAVQSVRRTDDPNASVEANLIKLTEAKQKLLVDPFDKAALSIVLTLLNDPNGINRSNAANTLGEVGEKHGEIIAASAVPALIDRLERGDEGDQYSALKALRGFGPHAQLSIPIVKRFLQSPDAQKTWIAAETLGRMKGAAREVVPDLAEVIDKRKEECRDDELNICRFAIQALGNIGPAATEARASLSRLLNNHNLYLRAYAAVALIRIESSGQEAVQVIAKLLRDPNVDVRRRTIWELKDAGKEAKPAESDIRAALRDKDEAVRMAASDLLEHLK
jgi:FOG: HEAT repeat